jgi:hypothetical protein
MALLFMDSFDHYGSGGGSGARVILKWDSGAVNGNLVAGRTGNAAALFNGDNLTKLLPAGTSFILGFAWRLPQLNASIDHLQFLEGATQHITVRVNTSGFLVVTRGGTILATATSSPMAITSWYYVEVKVVIHDTTGSVVCHVDGVAVTFDASLTGIDTRNGGTGLVDRVTLNGNSNSPFLQFDDLYICDTSGTTNNGFLGICVIEALLPQVGNGDLTALTPSTGTDHGALVDENPANDDTDYNTGDTAGQTDCYNYPSLALTGTILGVQTDLYARKTDAGARTIAPVFRIASTTYPGTAVAPTTTYKYLPAIAELNPATGLAWTSADITALQAGMKIVS